MGYRYSAMELSSQCDGEQSFSPSVPRRVGMELHHIVPFFPSLFFFSLLLPHPVFVGSPAWVFGFRDPLSSYLEFFDLCEWDENLRVRSPRLPGFASQSYLEDGDGTDLHAPKRCEHSGGAFGSVQRANRREDALLRSLAASSPQLCLQFAQRGALARAQHAVPAV